MWRLWYILPQFRYLTFHNLQFYYSWTINLKAPGQKRSLANLVIVPTLVCSDWGKSLDTYVFASIFTDIRTWRLPCRRQNRHPLCRLICNLHVNLVLELCFSSSWTLSSSLERCQYNMYSNRIAIIVHVSFSPHQTVMQHLEITFLQCASRHNLRCFSFSSISKLL
jgi:hypothetical protein